MTALECAFALLKCSPIGNPENSSEYGRAAYILSEHCQGKEDVSEAAMRIFAERIECLVRERDELQKAVNGLCEHFNVSPANTTLLAVELLKIERERDQLKQFLAADSAKVDSYLGVCIERDEALEATAKWESSSDAMERAGAEQARRADENREWALKAERERDEAREKAERYRLEANAMMLQRDEARAIAYDLATIASHCLGWHDHETGDAAERIASVLRRWKDAK